MKFDNGAELKMVDKHDLFQKETMKYVIISDANAEEFIGASFYSADEGRFVKLVAVEHHEEVDYYSLYTKYNYNCIAEGKKKITK